MSVVAAWLSTTYKLVDVAKARTPVKKVYAALPQPPTDVVAAANGNPPTKTPPPAEATDVVAAIVPVTKTVLPILV